MAIMESTNDYEEIRRQRVLENKKRFDELGIASLSRSLNEITNAEKKTERRARVPRPRPTDVFMSEPRRSTRERNQVVSYRDDVTIDVGPNRGRVGGRRGSNWDSNWATYVARPVEECRIASFPERARALRAAEKLQDSLESDRPSFIKSMVRSHVYSCFWLGLPTQFCKRHMPKTTTDFILESEDGSENEAVYIAKRAGLSGGWRAFALEHKIDDGDAVLFDLVEEARFKVYIVRALAVPNTDEPEQDSPPKKAKKQKKKSKKSDDSELDSAAEDDAPKKVKKQKNSKAAAKAKDPAVDSGRRHSARLK